MRRARGVWGALVALGVTLLWGVDARALETTSRQLLGWTASGNEIVLRLTSHGERMVDGVAQDFYYQLTELYSATDGTLLHSYRHGAASGAPSDAFENAKSQSELEVFVQTAGLVDARPSAKSPRSEHLLLEYQSDEVTQVESDQGPRFVCGLDHRLVLFDGPGRAALLVKSNHFESTPLARRADVECPRISSQVYWNPSSSQFAIVTTGAEGFELLVGRTDATDSFASAPFTTAEPWTLSHLPAGASADGWRALASGDLDRAASAFSASGKQEDALALALVHAFRGEGKKARKLADKAWGASPKSPWHEGLRAATYISSGELRDTTKWIEHAVNSCKTYGDLVDLAALFEQVDIAVQQQVLVHALSHPSVETVANRDVAWLALANAVITTGDFSQAEKLLESLVSVTRESRLLRARLAVDRGQANRGEALAAAMLRDNLGECAAYGVLGRIASQRGEAADAAALFQAAALCDPLDEDAQFYAADVARLAGALERSASGFARYLALAPARRSDEVRSARRGLAQAYVARFRHKGIVLLDAACRRQGEFLLCTGTVMNASDAPVESIPVALEAKRGKAVGSTEIPSAQPGELVPFGLRIERGSHKQMSLVVGRDKKERAINEQKLW